MILVEVGRRGMVGGQEDRRDDRDRSHRLPDGLHVDPGARIDRGASLEQMRCPTSEFDDFLTPRDLPRRIAEYLAVFARDDLRALFLALVEQLTEGEQYRSAPRERRVPPSRKGRHRRGNHGFDVRAAGEA
ncbi:DmpG-like protein [Amycolatopsis sulphurea]|uniref:DmpG-like protein n=1 Tax=Amycolatopsis sulphurea TaxID=76022 RepID=A0A2A9FIT8_9PSEU|nr:DmpG-like protein [Amycolatopsis sulphurea]